MEATDIAQFTAALATAGLDELAQVAAADLCELITALELAKNAAAAAQARAGVAAADALRQQAIEGGAPPSRAEKGIGAQIGLARRESPHAGSRHLGFARVLVAEMPHTHAAMTEGLLAEWTAMQLVRETACLSREHRGQVDAALADRFRTDSARQLVATARALAYELDPYAAVNRGRKAATDRRVSIRPAPEVMANLTGFLPVAQGVACYKALDESARAQKAAGDQRTLDQLRADLFIQRLTGASTADNPNIEVGLVMTDTALLGLDETAARLEHYGPIPAALARDLLRPPGGATADHTGTTDHTGTDSHTDTTDHAGTDSHAGTDDHAGTTGHDHNPDTDADPEGDLEGDPEGGPGGGLGGVEAVATEAMVWVRRLYADPVTGVLVDIDSRRRLFTGTLRRFLVARDQTCRTPWCDAPVRHVDHILPFARGGQTEEDNGEGMCEACNYDKEAPGWKHEQVPTDDGTHLVRITTPTGHTYESHAPPILPTLGLRLARPPRRLTNHGTTTDDTDSADDAA